MYDYLIVGSGLFGAVFAHEATQLGSYRYYDMDKVIAAALDAAEKELTE